MATAGCCQVQGPGAHHPAAGGTFVKRYLAALSAAMLLMAVMASVAVAKTTKVDICHYHSVTDSYALIMVSDNGKAVAAHLAHGDAFPGDPVPTMAGYVFDAACAPVLADTDGADTDGDGVPDTSDNCPTVANADQSDRYGSPKGDACEDDSNGDGILDVNETDICVSIDGVTTVGPTGKASCYSDHSTGSNPNIAVAVGDGAYADADTGDNNTAVASGVGAIADAYDGDNNYATATGTDASAYAFTGDNNYATATGTHATAYADNGNDNYASATGTDASAIAYRGDNNHATATGADAYALAQSSTGCTATAGAGSVVTCP